MFYLAETGTMPGAPTLLDPQPYRRGLLITAVSRWLAVAFCVACLAFLWNRPGTRHLPALATGLAYAAFAAVLQLYLRRRPADRRARRVHAVADALAVGAGAAFTGGLESPMWLLLYPHVVGYSVRGNLAFGAALGLLDAGIVVGLAELTPEQPLARLHSLILLWCGFLGGITSGYLQSVRGSLQGANRELAEKNRQLEQAVAAHRESERRQEQALARLRQSEERLHRLLERIQDGVLIIQDGRLAYANAAFAAIAGDTREALAGADFRDFVPVEDREGLAERYRRWEESQAQAGGFETRLLTRTGELRVVSVRAGSVEFEGRRSVVATIRDITRERRMEQEVKAHAERLAAINEIANAVNLSLTIEDIFAVAAEEIRRLMPFDRLTIALIAEDGLAVEVVAVGLKARRQRARLSREQVAWAFRRPTAWCECGDEPEPEHVRELMAEAEVRAVASVPLVSKERVIGSLCLGRLRDQPFATLDLAVLEPVTRHIAIALDNARLIEAVRQRSHEFESLLEIGRGILERLDLAELLPLVTRSVNEVMGTQHCLLMLRHADDLEVAAQEGLEPEVLGHLRRLRLGQSLTGWVAREGRSLAVSELQEDPRAEFKDVALRHGYRSYLGVPLRRGAEILGTLEVVTKQTRRFGPEDQELMGAFAAQAAVALENARLFEEVRSHAAILAEANKRLEELDRLRQQYLRNVSHEFRTPLTVIKGYAEYLIDAGTPDEHGLKDVMRVVVESCDRVIDMVDTLIEVSRVEEGGAAERTLQVQRLDLREVAAASLDPLRHAAGKKGIELATEFPSEPLSLHGDGGLLHQVVRKLVDNAVKYSPPGGRVVVRARAEGEELALEVQDQGIGIPPEHLPRIFEKFYMVDGGIARRVGGTGVGLYLVREIVRLHRGTVEVVSQPGQGSVFRVRLPREFRSTRAQAALA
jgi:PAS domain S-box-containing protein